MSYPQERTAIPSNMQRVQQLDGSFELSHRKPALMANDNEIQPSSGLFLADHSNPSLPKSALRTSFFSNIVSKLDGKKTAIPNTNTDDVYLSKV